VEEADFSVAEMESEGTKKLIALAGPIVDSLENGNVLFIDEIDARLHPLITTALVKLFNSPETNPRNAQLVCTTHDTNLLDRRYLRRDQIYFVEKDRTASTRLFSLADFKLEAQVGGGRTVRSDASYERNYIQGRYGAIPFIGDLETLFAEETPDVTETGNGQPSLLDAITV
jgi:AAA15 family ATPase/GTPase